MIKIQTPTCDYCGRGEQKTCTDCDRWKDKNLLTKNRAIFYYNEFLKEIISRFKYRGDYELVATFSCDFLTGFNQAFQSFPKTTKLVPIPLSDQRLKKRAFNQAEALAKLLPYEIQPLLKRISNEKQAKKNRQARLAMENPFELNETHPPEPVIIIDDIYTTGATIHHAAKVLKDHGYDQIASFTLAR